MNLIYKILINYKKMISKKVNKTLRINNMGKRIKKINIFKIKTKILITLKKMLKIKIQN